MGIFKKVFYNILSEDITTSVLTSNPGTVDQLQATDGFATEDDRIPYVYGPNSNKKKKNRKKANVFQRPEIVSYATGKIINEPAKAKR